MTSHTQIPQTPGRRAGTLLALILGLPMAVLIVLAGHHGPLRNTSMYRYVEFPVQWVEVAFFTCGVAALLLRWWQYREESLATDLDVLPRWDGKPVPAEKAGDLLPGVDRVSGRFQNTFFVRRVRSVLEFVCQRQSAQDLDDQMRSLADADSLAQESAGGLVRFITWAIPILGFLGTVIGITGAISGVTPEVLEESMSTVTDGLAEAFDSTALALGLTMVLMFITFLVDRLEQGLLASVDLMVERQLGHRFQRVQQASSNEMPVQLVEQMMTTLNGVVETMVRKQAELWVEATLKAQAEPEKRALALFHQVQETLTTALGQALDRTAESYARRLAALEQQSLAQQAQLVQQLVGVAGAVRDTGAAQQESLQRVATEIAAQASVLGKLEEDAANVVHLQAILHQNLVALANASSFEEAVHSLTAAVHMLTVRVAAPQLKISTQGQAA